MKKAKLKNGSMIYLNKIYDFEELFDLLPFETHPLFDLNYSNIIFHNTTKEERKKDILKYNHIIEDSSDGVSVVIIQIEQLNNNQIKIIDINKEVV